MTNLLHNVMVVLDGGSALSDRHSLVITVDGGKSLIPAFMSI